MEGEIRNRVAENDQLVVFDLEDYFPPASVKALDIVSMSQAGVFREKTVRDAIAAINPESYSDAVVAIDCSEDLLIPQWIWPMLSSHLAEYARNSP